MNPAWHAYLRTQNVVVHDSRVTNFGQPEREAGATKSGTILSDLSHLGLIRFAGEDAGAFLQGQLSCDVRLVTPHRARHGSYCSAKGRMLAAVLLWQTDGSYFMQLPRALREPVQKRLAMFVLRSKVNLADASDVLIRMGLAGSKACDALGGILGSVPEDALATSEIRGVRIIRLGEQRFEIVAPPENAPALWERLAGHAIPAGADAWDWHEIRAGIPVVLPSTQDQFVPQMANLELIGGVSFQKGCYPGQEIVARTHYLGKLKRRMYLAHLDSTAAPAPGDAVFADDTPGQAIGSVVNAAPAPDGGFDLLAVAQVSSATGGTLHWKAADGPGLQLLPLPYTM